MSTGNYDQLRVCYKDQQLMTLYDVTTYKVISEKIRDVHSLNFSLEYAIKKNEKVVSSFEIILCFLSLDGQQQLSWIAFFLIFLLFIFSFFTVLNKIPSNATIRISERRDRIFWLFSF